MQDCFFSKKNTISKIRFIIKVDKIRFKIEVNKRNLVRNKKNKVPLNFFLQIRVNQIKVN